MTEAIIVANAILIVLVIAGALVVIRSFLAAMGGQTSAFTEQIIKQSETHASQVAALVEVVKTPPGFAALPVEAEETVRAIDQAFQERPESVVQWDSSLSMVPGIDE